MRAIIVRFAAVVLMLVAGIAAATEANQYAALLARLKAGDTSIDFQALRYAYAELPDYSPLGDSVDRGPMIEAFNKADFGDALARANAILEKNYVSMDAHMMCAIVLNKQGKAQDSAFHLAVVRALRQSIERSGDGKTPDTAYVVIAVSEEYSFLNAVRLKVVNQALIQSRSGPVDAMTVTDPSGAQQTIYFNVAKSFAAMERALSPRPQH